MDSSGKSCLRARLLPAVAVLTVAATAAACSSSGSGSGSGTISTAANPAPLQDSYEAVVRAVLPSVVQISTDNSTGSGSSTTRRATSSPTRT